MARNTKKNAAPVVENVVETPAEEITVTAGATDELTADEETALELKTDESLPEVTGEVIDQLLDASLQQIAGEPDATTDEVQAAAGEPEQSDDEPAVEQTYLEARDAVVAEADVIELNRSAIAKGFDERAAFERSKNGFNETIHKSLDKSRAKLIQNHAVAALAVAGVAPDFMTYSTHTGSAYNVYAIDKLADLVIALNTGVMKNAVNLAIVKSLLALRAAGEQMTGELSKACVSQNIRVPGNANVKYLTRHTVSPSTAPTQASSTMQALQTLGIVRNAGSQKFPIYSMIDGPMTDRLEEVLKAA